MLKERIQEIFEFAKSESPYRKANKGWINQDIFLDLSSSSDSIKQRNEAAKVTLLWSPINRLLSNIFLTLIIGSIIVFMSLCFANGRFDLSIFNTSDIKDIVKVENKKVLETSALKDLDSINLKAEASIDMDDIGKKTKLNQLDDNQIDPDEKIKNNTSDKQKSIIKNLDINKGTTKIKNKKSNFI